MDVFKSNDEEIQEYGLDFWSDKASTGKWKLFNPKNNFVIADFILLQMPNCCAVCISTRSEVKRPYRKLGLGSLLNELRKDIAKSNRYSLLLCTFRDDNTAQAKILEKNDWKTIYSFENIRNKNNLHISIYDLSKHEMKI